MGYQLLNTLLPLGHVEKAFMKTFDMIEKKQDLIKSPVAEWGRRAMAADRYWYGCRKYSDQEGAIRRRLDKVVRLYHSIKENGYNGSNISIYFDEDGCVRTYDGFHRLNIMAYLRMRVKVNCVITPRGKDFPLAETMMTLNKGKNLYHPCDDPRLKGFKVWRPDSLKRYSYIHPKLGGQSVLDIGCAEGYFSRMLAKKQYAVTALDTDRRRIAVTRYLATLNNVQMNYHVGSWQKYMENLEEGVGFDNVLMLSVFHHDLLKMGPDKAFKTLQLLRGRVKRLFVETPTDSRQIKWLEAGKKKAFHLTEEDFKSRLEENTGMKITDTWRRTRPLFLLCERCD